MLTGSRKDTHLRGCQLARPKPLQQFESGLVPRILVHTHSCPADNIKHSLPVNMQLKADKYRVNGSNMQDCCPKLLSALQHRWSRNVGTGNN